MSSHAWTVSPGTEVIDEYICCCCGEYSVLLEGRRYASRVVGVFVSMPLMPETCEEAALFLAHFE